MRIPYEHGFMLTLLILAIAGLIWLFTPFIPALFLALLIAIATFSQYIKLQKKISNSSSALLMTFLVTVVLILPLSYILLISGLEISALIQNINTNFTVEQSNQLLLQTITGLPLSDSLKVTLNSALSNNLENFIINIKDFSVVILKSIVSLSSHFIFFLIITIFSLYYFYIDGKSTVKRLKDLSPLENHLDDILFNQFSSLSITLVGSVLVIAILQGLIFSIGVMMIGLPVLFLASPWHLPVLSQYSVV